MRWIKEHKIITCVAGVILALIIICALSFATGGSGHAGKAVNGAVTAEQDAANSGVSGIRGTLSGIFRYKSLQAENEALKKQVEELEQKVLDSQVTEDQLKQLKKLAKAMKYDAVKKGDIVSADVISFDGSNWMKSITINRGENSGIKKDDVVVCGTGLIGRVSETGGEWAKVIAAVDENSKTSFTVLRDSDVIGMLSGDGKGEFQGYVLDADSSIIEGDTLVTSGMGLYPRGIEMGTVTKVKYNADTQMKTVAVEPSVNFSGITKVTVIL